MVARGDLGAELPIEDVPLLQVVLMLIFLQLQQPPPTADYAENTVNFFPIVVDVHFLLIKETK